MAGSDKQPNKRLLTALYRAMLWLVAVIALGEAPSASEQSGRSGFRYVAESSFSGFSTDPIGGAAGHEACIVAALDDPDGPAPGHDAAETGDHSGLPPQPYATGYGPRLALGLSLSRAHGERPELAGMQARGPPAPTA
ncbi:hypothetical protein RB623_20720 [Mesorhizobium sp. LHD-90]|uniref:hypothetical protein n=1 Tax=Mesorhizobium sp. LHD-90 TaxID=3071414 RepID=UPI0027DF58AD|nr:hypothetical protein [Mesorhizobium sp. LHD-90]MDQ6436480.1 hypothetical protein [Mesorhizobium sp. LHD-90]